MKSLLNNFLFSISIQIPIILLSDNILRILSYVSIIVSVGLFFAGLYLTYKRRKYGIRIFCLSFLLLINPMINLVFN